jgi:curved DNA-binding protein
MEYKDYYKILGVDKNATKDEIKRAYRKLARQYHPDINPNNKKATAQFADINEANDVLSDDEKRRKYDMLGADWERYQSTGQQGPQQGFDWSKYGTGEGTGSYEFHTDDLNDMFGEGGFSDFFQSFFRSQQGQAHGQTKKYARKGQDYQAELYLDLEEAYTKTVKTITINDQNLRFTLEPGTRDNQTIKMNGKGGPGINGGKNGDLYITLKIKPHPVYKREGNDLFMDVPVSVYKAMLGGEQTVKLLSGSVKVKIPAETRNNTTVRIKGKGFPIYGEKGKFGDLYIRLELEIPRKLTEREKELVTELAQIRGESEL